MADNLMGTIIKSSDQYEIGQKVTFIGLRSEHPKIVFQSGGESPLQKAHEDQKSMTLLLVASATGGVDAFVINKNSGNFARASTGTLTRSIYASASVGTLK